MKNKLAAFAFSAACMIFSVSSHAECPAVAIMYHDVTDNPFLYSQYSVSVDSLEQDIKTFKENGYVFLKASELTDDIVNSSQKYVALTFDDGYESFYTKIFPLLKKYNVSASFYILTSEIDKNNHLSSYQLRELAQSELVELGAHSHYVHKLGREGIEKLYNGGDSIWDAYEDYKLSVETLEKIINKEVTSVAYPNGIYNTDIDWILKNELGIKVTLGTSFGSISSFVQPYNRINRDLNYSSAEFFGMVENTMK